MTQSKSAETLRFTVYIAGDYDDARRTCRQFCMERGFCVSVTPTAFVYTGGEEAGVAIGIINYPRFPAAASALYEAACALAEQLCDALYQHSYTIVGPLETVWVTRRAV